MRYENLEPYADLLTNRMDSCETGEEQMTEIRAMIRCGIATWAVRLSKDPNGENAAAGMAELIDFVAHEIGDNRAKLFLQTFMERPRR